ncbi:hypothetical protein UFB30_03810 [Jeotgalibacillus sp. HH7-29]|uniref:Uncharacterized protein n=2 Tax=Jeotgalibacillus haloalkalitolerans TaxID=3104292 RepID=A0ABU5KJI6_9BACL|nr:hypothetical protein [Jeotgalibacillus sp. HH7-29]
MENEANFKVLVSVPLISLVYTFIFMKNVIETFNSFLFYSINFLLIMLITMFIVGVNFGTFYFFNNERFGFYTSEDIEMVNSGETLFALLQLSYKGIGPFYTFPALNINQSSTLIDYTPLMEFIIGSMFNLVIVGFFISYSVSKISKA